MVGKIRNILNKWGPIDAMSLAGSLLLHRFNGFYNAIIAENLKVEDVKKYGYSVVSKGKFFLFSSPDKSFKVFCRKYSSDIDVLKQIFLDNEFEYLLNIIDENSLEIKNVIDAGSNIGLSTVKLGRQFPKAKIYAIEPAEDNFSVLQQNIAINTIQAEAIKTGIWSRSTRLYFDRTFRDGKEWAIALTEEKKSDNYVDAVSINDIVKKYAIVNIDLLKIDIEGGERYIFNEERIGLDFLKITKVIAIEIHDEYKISDRILDILNKEKFVIGKSGEYIIGVKQIG